MGGGGIHLIKNSPYFGNIQVNKEERDCLGIKVCRFTDPSLINIEHNEVDVESPLWKTINENQEEGNSKLLSLNQELKPGNKTTAWKVSSENL